MGPAGPGHRVGGRGSERDGPSGSAQTEGIVFLFFSNLFLMLETIPENLEIVLKARKILEKSQKFQENS
jgi:hypothetical protein